LTPITLRQRLNDYEFTDEQEMTLTLELVNRIEKDIDEIKATQPRQGFTLYLVLAGIAGTLYVLFSELSKLSEISFSKIGIILLASLLLLKIPWAFYQLVTLDHATKEQQKPGRFFWSNDFFFESRPSGVFQLILFLLSLIITFFLPISHRVAAVTAISFLLYVLIIGLIFILSFRKEAYKPDSSNKKVVGGLPILYIVFTVMSVIGLISNLKLPVGSEAAPYMLAGLLLAVIVLLDIQIRLSTPPLLLKKLQVLRYDIIFLKANLQDAWIRYDIHINGNDISEELRVDMDDIIQGFNSLDFQQSLKIGSLTAIQEESQKLQTREELTETDFESLNRHKLEFFVCIQAIDGSLKNLNPRLSTLADQVHKISRRNSAMEEGRRISQLYSISVCKF